MLHSKNLKVRNTHTHTKIKLNLLKEDTKASRGFALVEVTPMYTCYVFIRFMSSIW